MKIFFTQIRCGYTISTKLRLNNFDNLLKINMGVGVDMDETVDISAGKNVATYANVVVVGAFFYYGDAERYINPPTYTWFLIRNK